MSSAKMHFEQQAISFFLKCDRGIYIFEEIQKKYQDGIEDVHCPTWPDRNCVYLSTNKKI